MVGLASVESEFNVIAVDELAHHNLKDAVKLSGRAQFEYAHCDPQSLREGLKRYVRPGQRPLVVTDGVFPTGGEVPPLADYAPAS